MNRSLKKHIVFIYGLPGFPLAMLGLPLFVYLPSFYNQELGLSLFSVGLALLLARSFDVITDPLIGLLNDRFPKKRSKIWRRKSYIILGIPLLLIGLNYLLKPIGEISALYLFVWSFVTYLGWTLINIPWLALGAEMTADYHEKSTLSSSREIYAVIGTILVISLPVLLSIDSDLKLTLETLATVLTLLLPLSLIPLLMKVSIMSESSEIRSVRKISKRKPFTKSLLSLIKEPAIKRLLPAYFINSIANALPATLFILFVSHVLMTPDKVGLLLISYFVSAIIGIPLWLALAKKTDKHISWSIALCGSILSFMWVPFLSQGDFIYFLIICFFSGFFLGADLVIPASIQADISQSISTRSVSTNSVSNVNASIAQVTDGQIRDKQITDQIEDSTGVLFGLWGLITKLSMALAIGVAFPLLDLVGLETNDMTAQVANTHTIVNSTAVMTLTILYALIPIILKVWVLCRMWNFPFNKTYFSSRMS